MCLMMSDCLQARRRRAPDAISRGLMARRQDTRPSEWPGATHHTHTVFSAVGRRSRRTGSRFFIGGPLATHYATPPIPPFSGSIPGP